MRYYDDTISKVKRTWKNSCGDICEQFIFITKITKQFLYGNSWNGRWKCDRKTNAWYRYDNYMWKRQGGDFQEVGE